MMYTLLGVCDAGVSAMKNIIPSEEPLLPWQDIEEPSEAEIESEPQLFRGDPQNSIDPRIGSGAVTHLPMLPALGKMSS